MIAGRIERIVAFGLTGVVAFAIVAVPLAMFGAFHPIPVVTTAVVAWLVLWRLWGRDETADQANQSASPAARHATVVVVVIVLLITGINVRYSSQHLLTERDPGVYNTTAKSMAETGRITIAPEMDVYRGAPNESRITYEAAGFFRDTDTGTIYPQFVHLFQATLGASSWLVGVRGMLKVNALLGGLALLVFYLFSTRLMPGWAAAGATVALGLNLVQVNFTRDSYTEVLTQILLFGGLWALMRARSSQNARRALISGALIGTTGMARADAFIFLVPLAAYVIYELIVAPSMRDHRLRRYLAALSIGAAVPTAIAGVDLRVFSPAYLDDNWQALRLGFVGLVAVIAGGAGYLWLRPRLNDVRRWFFNRRHLIAASVAIGIVVIAFLAYYVRPHLQQTFGDEPSSVVEFIQMREDLRVDGQQTYAESSMVWLALYLGPVALWAGVIGLAVMTREVLLGLSRRLVPFLLAMMSMSVLYVWDPAITPDHLWALRRYLPITIPGLLICCFWLLSRIWRAAGNDRAGSVARIIAVAAASFAIAFPAWTLWPFIRERSQVGVLNATDQLCNHLPDDAAVIVAQTSNLEQNYMQTVRAFCGVPVASAPMDQPLDFYRELARRWSTAGRSLYVVSPQTDIGTFWPPTSQQIASTRYRNIERTLRGRPDDFEWFDFSLFVTKVEPTTNASAGGS